jgi:kynureninase
MNPDMITSTSYADQLDLADPFFRFRKRFYIPENTIYMDGNSLGLLSADAEASLQRALAEWRLLGIRGWLEAQHPWFWLAENIGNKTADIVGADVDELVLTGGTTVNIHALLSTFYQPQKGRSKILADELNFPSDLYAIKGQIRLRGLDPDKELLLAKSQDGRTLNEQSIVDMMTEEVALVYLPSVIYTSGQLLDMAYLTSEAHKRGIEIGFDCSHSAGAVPHQFSEWGVDFAAFCGYKYLNGGPGCPAFLYVNKKHFNREPLLAGWFGSNKEKQFDLSQEFEHARGAGGWQISSPCIIGSATLDGSLRLFHKAGIDAVRKKSLALTTYFIDLVNDMLTSPPYNFTIVTPTEPHRRGGHVALAHKDAWPITLALKANDIIPDFRAPDIIRFAPVALYNRFSEVLAVVNTLKKIIDTKQYRQFSHEKSSIT